jgi:flagella basal body P-ring formation protein FlgA
MKPRRANSPHRPAATRLRSVSCLGLLSLALYTHAENSDVSQTNQAPLVQLRSAVQVDSGGVFLSQILEHDPGAPALRLCDAPAFGKSALLKRAEVAELARAAGLDNPFTNWAGPEAVRISRRVRPLAEQEIVRLLSSVLQKQFVKDQGELELRLSQPWATTSVPDETLALKVLDLPTTGVAPVFIVRFELETAHGEHIGPWQAPLQAKVWREVWVAASGLKHGQLIRVADLHRERRDMLTCREPLAEFAPDDPSLEFCESVQAGSPIFARFIRPRAIVHRGQSLMAMVHDGALMITLKVEALEDGAAGQIIRVRNPLSRRDLHGKVLDEENVLVSL